MTRRVEVVLALDPSQYVAGGKRAVDTNRNIESSVDKVNNSAKRAAVGTKQFGDDSVRGFSRSAVAAALMEGSFSKVATTAAGFFAGALFIRGTQALLSGVKRVITAGMDMNETLSKTRFAFGSGAEVIIAQADQMADRFGSNKQTFIDSATVIGLIGKAAGQTAPQAAAMGANFAKLAADVSSFHNVPVADALAAIQSGLVGEAEPLRRYGVLLNESAVAAEAVRLGLASSGAELSDSQKVMARASLITLGFKDASGDLARTQDSLSNRFRAIQGHVANFAAELGIKAQPAMSELLDVAYRLGHEGLDVVSAAADRLGPFLSGVARVGENLGPIFSSVLRAVGPLSTAFGALAGAGIIDSLNLLGTSLGAVASFLAQHRVIVEALTVLYISRFVPAAAEAALGVGRFVAALAYQAIASFSTGLQSLVTIFGSQRTAAAGAAMSIEQLQATVATTGTTAGGFQTAMIGLSSSLLNLVPAAAIGGLLYFLQVEQQAKRETDQFVDSLVSRRGENSLRGVQSAIQNVTDASAELRKELGADPNEVGSVERFLDRMPLIGDAAARSSDRARDSFFALSKELTELRAEAAVVATNENYVTLSTGLTRVAVERLATSLGVNLATAGRQGIATLIAAANASRTAGAAAGQTADQFAQAAAKSISSFASGDVIGDIVSKQNALASSRHKAATSGETVAEREHKIAAAHLGVRQAQLTLIDATTKLNEVRRDASSGRRIADAERAYAAAQDDATRSVWDLLDAEHALQDFRENMASGRTAEEYEIAYQRAVIRSQAAAEALTQAQEKLAAARDHGTDLEIQQSERELLSAQLDQTDAGFGLQDAQRALNRSRGDAGTIARDLSAAELGVADAQRSVAASQGQILDTVDELNRLRQAGNVRDLAQAELDYAQAVLGVAQAQDSVAAAMRRTNDAAAGQADKFTAADVTLDQFSAALGEKLADVAKFKENIGKIPEDVRQYFIDLGPASAPALDLFARSTGGKFEEIHQKILAIEHTSSQAYADEWAAMFAASGQVVATQGPTLFDQLAAVTTLGVIVAADPLGMYFGGLANAFNIIAKGTGAKPIEPPPPITRGSRNPTTGEHYNVMAKGGVDAHIVDRPTVLYGERETGGEAFVPRKGISPAQAQPILSEAAGWHGFGLVPMARGGVLPAVDDLSRAGEIIGGAGMNVERAARAAVERYLAGRGGGGDGASAVPLAGGTIGQGWHAITSYLDRAGVAYTITSTTGGHHVAGSLHYLGKAVDMVGKGRTTMRDIFNALAAPGGRGGPVKGMNELFFDPAGYHYDLGRYVPGAIGGHSDHVHAATFDRGGMLQPGWNAAYNGTGSPEWVPDPSQSAGGVGGGAGAGVVVHYAPVTNVYLRAGLIADREAVRQEIRDAAGEVQDEGLDELRREMVMQHGA